jgi:signal transduction histidine kinase
MMAIEPNGRKGVATATSVMSDTRPATLAGLRRLERVFAAFQWRERSAFVRARRHARARALEVLEGGGAGNDESQTALLIAAAELFGAMRVELAAAPQDTASLAGELEELTGLSMLALAREVLRAPELLGLLPSVAVEIQLAMLTAFAPLRSASLWTIDDAQHVNCVCHVGEGGPSRGANELARRLLMGESPELGSRRLLVGLPVGRWQQPVAVLVGSAIRGMRERCQLFLGQALPMLGAILERDTLLAANAASERTLVHSSERKLTRLGFDLHDGPIQDVAILAEDLHRFRDQLDLVLTNPGHRELMRGRVDDLDAQLAALDAEMRRISNEVHASSVLLSRSFPSALRDIVQAFAARTNIEPELTLDGDMRRLSPSQQIALLNVIHEALTNIREHSHATRVQIAVSVNSEGVEAQVIDNGRGFELEATLIRAARKGRLGLVAMHERVRLLGGQCRIDSRPGGPTTVTVLLEPWEPLQQEPQPRRISA